MAQINGPFERQAESLAFESKDDLPDVGRAAVLRLSALFSLEYTGTLLAGVLQAGPAFPTWITLAQNSDIEVSLKDLTGGKLDHGIVPVHSISELAGKIMKDANLGRDYTYEKGLAGFIHHVITEMFSGEFRAEYNAAKHGARFFVGARPSRDWAPVMHEVVDQPSWEFTTTFLKAMKLDSFNSDVIAHQVLWDVRMQLTMVRALKCLKILLFQSIVRSMDPNAVIVDKRDFLRHRQHLQGRLNALCEGGGRHLISRVEGSGHDMMRREDILRHLYSLRQQH